MLFARRLLALIAVLDSAAWASGSTCINQADAEDPAACSTLDGDANAAKVVMLQNSFAIRSPQHEKLQFSGEPSHSALQIQGHNSGLQALAELSSAQNSAPSSSDAQHKSPSDAQQKSGNSAPTSASVLEYTSASASTSGVGSSACPCIGISGRNGSVFSSVTDRNGTVHSASYPIDLGSSCQRWDYMRHPDCSKARTNLMDPAWCLQKWCYVDPCKCKFNTVPKVATYFPGSRVQDKSVYYSYEACGENDQFTSNANTNACVNQKTTTDCFKLSQCSWSMTRGCVGKELTGSMCATSHLTNAMIWGQSDCSCIGVNGTTGWTMATMASGNATVQVNMTSNAGATCGAWDDGVNPACKGPGPTPAWCKKKWCFVDPCKCGLNVPPKLSTYFVGAKWLGHQVYYSYAACGFVDDYTAAVNKGACTNQKTKAACAALGAKCSWTVMNQKDQCLGTDLANLCSSSAGSSSGGSSSGRNDSQQNGAGRAGLFLGAAPLLAVTGLRAV